MAAVLLIRCTPLLSTTTSLTFALCEELYLRPYTTLCPSSRDSANAMLPAYIRGWFRPGFTVILTLYPLTWVTATANLVLTGHRPSPRVWSLYSAGLFFSIAHMLWGPKAKGLLDRIRAQQHRLHADDSVAVLKTWLRLNAARSLLVDLPGWACFFAGFLLSEK